MSNLLTYSGILTKIKAMGSNLITKEEYAHIVALESVSNFISYLKHHRGFSRIFQGIDEYTVHRGELERSFIHGLYLDFTKIYQFANMEQRKALGIIFFRYEVNILKECILSVYGEKEDYDLSRFESFFAHHSKLNINALSKAESMDEFIGHLKGSRYANLFVKLASTGKATPFDYETELDNYYFKTAWRTKSKFLKGTNLKTYTNTLGAQIDLFNIMCLYRSKKFFSTNSSEYYGYIVPVNYKLERRQLGKLLETQSIDDFYSVLRDSYYKDFVPFLKDRNPEQYMDTYIHKLYKKNSNKYPHSMAPIFYYLNYKEEEINNITTALECIRYAIDPTESLKYLLLYT